MAEKTVQTAKKILEKVKKDNIDPYLAMLEVRNTPVDNYKSSVERAPVSINNLTVKPLDNYEFSQKRWDMKSKQKEYYDQHTKEQKMLHKGQTVQRWEVDTSNCCCKAE